MGREEIPSLADAEGAMCAALVFCAGETMAEDSDSERVHKKAKAILRFMKNMGFEIAPETAETSEQSVQSAMKKQGW